MPETDEIIEALLKKEERLYGEKSTILLNWYGDNRKCQRNGLWELHNPDTKKGIN